MQYEFIMHFMVPVEFSMSAKSPRAILIKYVLIVHSALVSFSSFSHKTLLLFQAENFLDLDVRREASQFARELMQFTVSPVSHENYERRGWRVFCDSGVTDFSEGQYNRSLQSSFGLQIATGVLRFFVWLLFRFSKPVILLLFGYLLKFLQ